MAEEEEKSLVQKLLETAQKATGFLGKFPNPGPLYPGQPLIGPGGRELDAPGLTDPVRRKIVEQQRREKAPGPVKQRLAAGDDAREAPDPVPLPGPVQDADPSEYRGIAAEHPRLFESGLVNVNGQRTPAGMPWCKMPRQGGRTLTRWSISILEDLSDQIFF